MKYVNLIRIAQDGGTVIDDVWEEYLIEDSKETLEELLDLTDLTTYEELLNNFEGWLVEELLNYLGVYVEKDGSVWASYGTRLTFSYNMTQFTIEEVMKDVVNNHLKKFESMLKIGIYKLERI